MTIQDELTLSYYKTIADINAAHDIYLVQEGACRHPGYKQ